MSKLVTAWTLATNWITNNPKLGFIVGLSGGYLLSKLF